MSHLSSAQILAIQAKITTLETARDSGVLMVRHGDTQTTFRSTAEIQKAIDLLNASLREPGSRRRVRYLFQSSKGLE